MKKMDLQEGAKKLDLQESLELPSMITLYHGSPSSNVKSQYGKGKEDNDYGSGFYMTPDFDLACEWACGHIRDKATQAYVYEYQLDLENLKLFNFYDVKKYRTLVWITELMKHRKLDLIDVPDSVMGFLVENFDAGLDTIDVIIGPRADDSYFSFALAFAQNRIDVGELTDCLEEGNLGVQYCCKSCTGFDCLSFIERKIIEGDDFHKYLQAYWDRDLQARMHVKQLLESTVRTGKRPATLYNIIYNWNKR